MSSIVKDELDKIKSFAESTEKRGSKLTLNELNYISDKQLHQKSSGGDSPVGIANIVFHTPNEDTNPIDNYVKFIEGGCQYVPAGGGSPAITFAFSDDALNQTASQWNRLKPSMIVPAAFLIDSEYPNLFEIEITGDAEIMPFSPEPTTSMVYVTGDCTITFVPKQV